MVITRTWAAQDACGNRAHDDQTITVAGDGNLVLTWTPVAGATWYQLWVNRGSTTYRNLWLEQTTATYEASPPFPCGSYKWWVRAWGPVTGLGDWSPANALEVTCCLPGEVVPLAPTGPLASGVVEYVWQGDPCATWYQVWVNRNSATFTNGWFHTGRRTDTLSTDPADMPDHPFGAYQWWVRGWYVDGYGPWPPGMPFDHGLAVPLEPSGLLAAPPTRLLWDDSNSSAAEWYQVWVNRNGSTVWHQWVATGDTTSNGDDRSLEFMMVLPAGHYTWWVRTWKTDGLGPWSDGLEFEVP
jgi:hypothetical protein